MGSDTIVDVAKMLNTAKGGFRKVDLLATINSVGTENDIISGNVVKNMNYISEMDSLFNDGPNIARDSEKTQVFNILRKEAANDLSTTDDVQFSVYQEINQTLLSAISKRDFQKNQLIAFKDNLQNLFLIANP